MKSRHGQWLIVIKKSTKTKPAKTQKAATRHRPQPPPTATNRHQQPPNHQSSETVKYEAGHRQWLTAIKKIKTCDTLSRQRTNCAASTRPRPLKPTPHQ